MNGMLLMNRGKVLMNRGMMNRGKVLVNRGNVNEWNVSDEQRESEWE
jgi:hypothetical protein